MHILLLHILMLRPGNRATTMICIFFFAVSNEVASVEKQEKYQKSLGAVEMISNPILSGFQSLECRCTLRESNFSRNCLLIEF